MNKEVRPDTSVARRRGSVRPWWCRCHTYFLALLVLLNIILDGFVFRPKNELAVDFFWAGILLAQTFLMGLWMAFGGLNAALRGVAVAAATMGGILAVSNSPDPVLAPLGGVTVLATYVLLLSLRLSQGWRIDFDEAYHANPSQDRMQLRLADRMNILTAFALLLGCARWSGWEYLPIAAAGGGPAFFNSLPIVFLLVAPRPSARAWLLCAAVLGASLIVDYATMVYVVEKKPELIFPFEFGLVATLLLNLLPLRFIFGLHLFSVATGVEPPAELERGLAEVEAAWPTLPETIRAEIVTLARSESAAEG